MAFLLLYPVLYGFEVFLASAFVTQVAVSVVAVIVSTATFYYCRHQVNLWREHHEENVLIWALRSFGNQGDKHTRARIKISKPFDEYASGDTDRSSSESDVFDNILSERLPGALHQEEYGAHRKIRSHLRSEPTPDRSGRERRGQGEAPAGLGARSYSLPAVHSDRQKSRRPKLSEAMHRSHWVAKPQQSASIVRKGILIPTSESEFQGFVPPVRKRRDRSRESPRKTLLSSFSSSVSSSSAESEDVHAIYSECMDLPHATPPPSIQEIKKPEETSASVNHHPVPSIHVEAISEDTIKAETTATQEKIPSERDNAQEQILAPGDESSKLSSLESSQTKLAVVISPNKDSDNDITKKTRSTSVPRFYTETCTNTVTVHVTPAEDTKTERPKRRSSPPVILAAIAYPGDDDGNHVDEIVLPYNRPVHNVSTPQVTHEELPKTRDTRSHAKSPTSVVTSEEIHLARQDSLGVPSVYVGEVSFHGPLENRPPPPPYCVAIKDVTPRHISEDNTLTSKLDVPQVTTGEISLPPLPKPSEELVRQDQVVRNRESIHARRLSSQKVRPRSLDIPIIVTTPYDVDWEPQFDTGHGVKRKHSSILKRSNSTERAGQKKSVTFSPDIPPYDESKRGSRRGGRVCKRQKAISHSVDSPDPTIPHAEFDFGSFLTMRYDEKPPPTYEEFLSMSPLAKWSVSELSAKDTFSRASGQRERVSQATLIFDRSWPHPFSQTTQKSAQSQTKVSADLKSVDDDNLKKSAKDRFFEACGTKAVISVLCTQESINEPSGIRMPDQDSGIQSPRESAANDDGDQPPDVTYTATRPLSNGGAAKSRFFGVKEDELLTSRLFVQTVRYSVDSDTVETEKLSAPNSPTLVEEEEPDDEDDDDPTSAKSRFMLSCKDEEGEEDEADDEASMAMDTEVTRRRRRQPADVGAVANIEVKEDSGESEDSSDDDQDILHTISSRGSDRYRGFLEASTEDIGFFDSDSEEGSDNLDFDSIKSISPEPISRVETESPSLAKKLEEMETETSTITRPSIKYSNVLTASPCSPRYLSETAIVLDNGSEVLKAGMAGNYFPNVVIPTVIGRKKSESSGDHVRGRTKRAFIGHEVMGSKHGVISFDYPIEDGIVDNWNDLEAIWEHVMQQELVLTSGEHPILLSEIASAPRKQKEKCLEVMFEKLNVPALYVANQAALALYANADTSGLVLSSGSGITEVIPVLDGNTLKHAVTTLDIAGKEVTRQLGRLLQMEKGYSFSSSSERETLRNMKESLAYVCSDYDAEMLRVKHASPSEYRLPDGSPLSVDQSDLFRCTEPLFQPEIAGIMHQSGVTNLIKESLQRCDSEFLSTREPSILLTGGNTKLTGFVERFQNELKRAKVDRAITAPDERIYSTWVGGSILASHSSFSERCISMEDYSEHGANIVNRRSSLF